MGNTENDSDFHFHGVHEGKHVFGGVPFVVDAEWVHAGCGGAGGEYFEGDGGEVVVDETGEHAEEAHEENYVPVF